MVEGHFKKLEYSFNFCSSSENFRNAHYPKGDTYSDTSYIFGEILYSIQVYSAVFTKHLLSARTLLDSKHAKMKRQSFFEGNLWDSRKGHENSQ